MKDEALKLALEALESCTPEDTSTGHVVWPSYDEQAVEQAITAIKQALATQPAVPDAFGTREGEHPQYVQGWNDCRAEMLSGRKLK